MFARLSNLSIEKYSRANLENHISTSVGRLKTMRKLSSLTDAGLKFLSSNATTTRSKHFKPLISPNLPLRWVAQVNLWQTTDPIIGMTTALVKLDAHSSSTFLSSWIAISKLSLVASKSYNHPRRPVHTPQIHAFLCTPGFQDLWKAGGSNRSSSHLS